MTQALRKKKSTINSFLTFNPKDYLKEYYSNIGSENEELLRFFADAYRKINKSSVLLEFSGGPTIYPLISAAPVFEEIHFADFLEKNLNEVKAWWMKEPKLFDWSPFVKRALEIEGKNKINKNDILERETLLRKKLTRFLYCDAYNPIPLEEKYRGFYDAVNVNFVPDSITSSKKIWTQLVKNISSLIKKDGILIMSALKEATHWRVSKSFFPAVYINEKDVEKLLRNLNFKIMSFFSINAEVLDEKSDSYEGYKGMMFITAKKYT